MKSNKGVKSMEFRVGDKVRIRDDLIEGKVYGRLGDGAILMLYGGMSKQRGKEGVITHVSSNGQIKVNDFYWHKSMLEPVCKFKVGDLVIGNHPTRYGVTKKGWIGRVISIENKSLFRVKSIETGVEFNVNPKYFDLYTEPELKKIVITTDGVTTLARLYEGKKVVKSAEAKRSPADEFDFTKGAELAFNRLLGKKPETKPETKPEEEKLYNGKVVCVDNINNPDIYTVGKIYEFKDGFFTENSGGRMPDRPMRSFTEWTKFSASKWLEIKE